eukprot:CAMPEP_0119145922 /NCGR_PEP_ID=MMETSP1310-20130426/38163_1 /TAXON_ID=464262 /ORGANISM="Genus nov. species nov., Strain RCC2339" /LENGTH=615 /DNA_ID=CAMNT_0007137771 /DNA_START=3 /DNA_END=1850 /DNA_ORIENTATION=-
MAKAVQAHADAQRAAVKALGEVSESFRGAEAICESLQKICEFHTLMSAANTTLSQTLSTSIAEPVKALVYDDIRNARDVKKKFDRCRNEYTEAKDAYRISLEKSKKASAKEKDKAAALVGQCEIDLDRAHSAVAQYTKEATHQLDSTLSIILARSISCSLKYLEAHYEYFRYGSTWLYGILNSDKMKDWKSFGKRAISEYDSNLRQGAGAASVRVFGVPLEALMDREVGWNKETVHNASLVDNVFGRSSTVEAPEDVDPILDTSTSGEPLVPTAVREMIQYLLNHCLSLEGIFRISPSQGEMESVRCAYDRGEKVDIAVVVNNNPHIAAGLLKKFVRALPEPLCTFDLFQEFLHTNELDSDLAKIHHLREVVSKLPRANLHTLHAIAYLCFVLGENRKVNKMGYSNLGIVFAPGILYAKDTNQTMGFCTESNEVISILFEHAQSIFDKYELPLTGPNARDSWRPVRPNEPAVSLSPGVRKMEMRQGPPPGLCVIGESGGRQSPTLAMGEGLISDKVMSVVRNEDAADMRRKRRQPRGKQRSSPRPARASPSVGRPITPEVPRRSGDEDIGPASLPTLERKTEMMKAWNSLDMIRVDHVDEECEPPMSPDSTGNPS